MNSIKEKTEYDYTDSYKLMMDEILEKHEKGELIYLTKEEFLERINRK